MSKVCIIDQSCGLGDILLACKIGTHFASLGYEVVWPVEKIYEKISNNVETQGFDFVGVDSDFQHKEKYKYFISMEKPEIIEEKDYIFVPLRRSFHSPAGQIINTTDSHDAANMHGKFAMCGIDYEDWQDFYKIKRDEEKEEKLFKFLNLNQPYHLINKNFGTPPKWRETLNKDITTPEGEKRVMMFMDPRFSVFDWLKVFEKACRIDTVSTSTFYLFEKVNLNCVPTIYSRNNSDRSYEENFSWLERLARKEYKFIS